MSEKEEKQSKYCHVCGDFATCKTDEGYLCDKKSCHEASEKKAKTGYLNDTGVLLHLSW